MRPPNFILMLMDNLGYGDVGCYGSRMHRTPNIDRLAAEGLRFTSHYSCSGVCTPSRASLMTGCYPRRVNMHVSGNNQCVLFPADKKGLSPDERTIATVLRQQGYATGCVGKWHLGDQEPFLPVNHGFDSFFGCPYSEDMVPDAGHARKNWPPLPLMRDRTVVEAPADRTTLTRRYTEEALRFMRANRDQPFFLYLPHAMPGSTDRPFSSDAFAGKSANGAYGDSIEELDWSAGMILDELHRLGIDDNTLVVWTSDNGAVGWQPRQGSNAPLRGWGYSTDEGGQRVPCIVRWNGHVAAGEVTDALSTMMDLLPTFARLAGTEPPPDRVIDGHDLQARLSGAADASPYDDQGFFYYYREQLQAVRAGPWKLYLPLARKLASLDGSLAKAKPAVLELYDVRHDISETQEVSAAHPEVVQRLLRLADTARADLGDLEREGRGQRPAGWVDQPRPQVLLPPGA
ncbi:MAG: sulfatase [Lentisphaerae bacterium]|nr:sulfatase [Lentisphaerota bacterium]